MHTRAHSIERYVVVVDVQFDFGAFSLNWSLVLLIESVIGWLHASRFGTLQGGVLLLFVLADEFLYVFKSVVNLGQSLLLFIVRLEDVLRANLGQL